MLKKFSSFNLKGTNKTNVLRKLFLSFKTFSQSRAISLKVEICYNEKEVNWKEGVIYVTNRSLASSNEKN